ncbi:MAG: sialate O-acetylesterase [Deltaproteobacteria bacterium]|nr:sialate O-acetylesterase [Deltaproteobacteria bacterium]
MTRLWVHGLAALLAAGLLAEAAAADVELPRVFGPDMVLQQGQPVPVWGRAASGEKVTVTIAEQSATARTNGKGRWKLTLAPLAAGGPHTMTVRGKNEIQLTGVLVGEVWICSGQSNMAWAVRSAANAKREIAAADFPRIRLLTVPRRPMAKPQDDFEGAWTACSPNTIPNFSAVGYYFGRALHLALYVPVGLINTSYGGTPAEAWTSYEGLKKVRALRPLVDRYDQAVKRYPKLGARHPTTLYNGMIAPLLPFAVRGAIWYQGESNAGRAVQYRTLFPAMIRDWRGRWGQERLPFYFVQLANFKAAQPEPRESAWAELREAQTATLTELPDTGMAVIIDIGDAKNIHPKNKQDVGKRLAAWALAKDYDKRVPFSGPLYKSMRVEKGAVIVEFDHVEGGLVAKDGKPLGGFAMAGRGKRFRWAGAEIVGDTVVVSCPGVKHPRAVRYGWADNPAASLYNKAGFPASPFRTDDWPLTTAGKN